MISLGGAGGLDCGREMGRLGGAHGAPPLSGRGPRTPRRGISTSRSFWRSHDLINMQMDMSMVQTSTQYTVHREQRLASSFQPGIGNVTQDTHGLFKTVEGVFMQSRSHEDELKKHCNDADRLRQDLQRALQENEKLKAKTLEEERSRISDSTVRLTPPHARARLAPPRSRCTPQVVLRLTSPARSDERRAPQQSRDHGRDSRRTNGA
eukprot:scaffold3418_cov124-Isochrysis_galbana.AAC.27